MARINVANGYTVPLHASRAVVCDLMSHDSAAGAYTPSRPVGKDLVERLPGSAAVWLTEK